MIAPLRRARFAFPLLCVASVLAGIAPMVTAPHEANACSGSGGGLNVKYEALPKIESAEATERDLLVVLEQSVYGNGPGAPPSTKATAAHLETADGVAVPTSRNDFADPTIGTYRRVVIPAAPLAANTDYVLVVENVLPDLKATSQPTTVRVPFKTGDKLHAPLPLPKLLGETSRAVDAEVPLGLICCGASADYVSGGSCSGPGKGTPPTCATTHRLGVEAITVAWEIPAGSPLGGGNAAFFAEVVTTPENLSKAGLGTQTLSLPPIGNAGTPFSVFVETGRKACVTLLARDFDTKEEKRGETTCFDASAGIPAQRSSCADLVPLVTDAKSKAGCLANAELAELLKECPGAPGSGGASGAGGSNVAGAGGSTATPAGSGGSSGTAAAGGASAGSALIAGSGGASSGAGPASAPASDGGCSLGDLARSDGSATLAPLFAALAGVWAARRRRSRLQRDQRHRRIERAQIVGVAGDDQRVDLACDDHHGGIDDVTRLRSTAENADRFGQRAAQRDDLRVLGADEGAHRHLLGGATPHLRENGSW